MKKVLKHRTTRIGLLLVPVGLLLCLKRYVSTPQYAFNRYMAAVRNGDIDTAKRLTTPRYFAALQAGDPNDPLYQDRTWEKAIRDLLNAVWERPDATHAHVTYTTATQRETWRYYLVETKEGWKIDKLGGGFY